MERRLLTSALAVAVAAALVSCATGLGDDPEVQPPADAPLDVLASFPTCDDAPTLGADASWYRDEPQYGNPMELVDAVLEWAEGEPGFEEIWLDRSRNGWVHVGFDGKVVDADALQIRVTEEFPGEGVVVVAVPHTAAELAELHDRVLDALSAAGATPAGGSAVSAAHGNVSLWGVAESPEAEAALAPFVGEPLCVETVPLAAIVPEGPQQTAGEGWRLLGHAQGVGEPYRTGVASTDEQLEGLWRESGLLGAAPAVDWEREIAVWFGAVYGSGCPVRLDGVVVDGATLHGEIVIPGTGPMSVCNSDANPHSFVVAVERSLLPVGPFVVQLDAHDPPVGAPLERTVVDVDLSAPGARAADGELHPDTEHRGEEGPLVEDGHDGMPDGGSRYVWHPRPECGTVVIGPFDSSLWRLADGEADWAEAAGAELILFPVDSELLLVSSSQMDYAFVRAPDGAC